MELSIILPIYNEVENIQPLLREIEDTLNPTGKSFEVIAIDDGSKDGSTKLLEKLSVEKKYLKVIFFRRNSGQSAAFDAGFRHTSGEFVFTMDSDRQNDPKDILAMLKLLETDYDFVSGWRKKRRDGFILRTFPSLIANWIIRKVTRTTLHDMGCSLKGYRKEIADNIRVYGEMHRFIAVLAENLGARVTEFEVHHRPRVAGKSKYGLARTFKVLLDLLTIWFIRGYQTKPIYVFGSLGFGMISLSFIMAAFVLYEKFALGVWVHRNPIFILSASLFTAAVQFFAIGLLSEMIIRTYFESQEKKSAYHISHLIGFSEGFDGGLKNKNGLVLPIKKAKS